MSHIAQCSDVPIRSLEVLREVCAVNGWQFMEGQRTYRWFGRFVGDTKMPDDMTLADLGRCDHAIAVPGCQYEIGVRQREDGTYRLVWDYYRPGGLYAALGGEKMPKLLQSYNVELLKAETRRLGGYVDSEERLEDGSVRLRLLAAR